MLDILYFKKFLRTSYELENNFASKIYRLGILLRVSITIHCNNKRSYKVELTLDTSSD